QELVLALARDRAAAGDAVVVVLHDLNLAAGYADRVAVLDRGRVAAVGAPAEVLQPDLLSGVYQHAVEVLPHPRTAAPIILSRRLGWCTGMRLTSVVAVSLSSLARTSRAMAASAARHVAATSASRSAPSIDAVPPRLREASRSSGTSPA